MTWGQTQRLLLFVGDNANLAFTVLAKHIFLSDNNGPTVGVLTYILNVSWMPERPLL